MPPACLHRNPVARWFFYQDKKTLVPLWERAQAHGCDHRNHHSTLRPPGRATPAGWPRTVHGAARRGTPPHRLLHRQRRAAHHRRGPVRERVGPRTRRGGLRIGVRRPSRSRRPPRRPVREAPAVPGRHAGLRADLAGVRARADRVDAGRGAGRPGRRVGGDAAAGARHDPVGDGRTPPGAGDGPVRRHGGPRHGGGPDPRRCPGGGRHRGHELAGGVPGERPGRAARPVPRGPYGPRDPFPPPGAGGRPRHGPAGGDPARAAGPADRGQGGGLAAVDMAVAGGVPVPRGGVLRGGAPGGPRGPHSPGSAEPLRAGVPAPRSAADPALLDGFRGLHVRDRGGASGGGRAAAPSRRVSHWSRWR
ncbi:hypothetical protein QFZ32_006140 [Streptomyces canus]|nr:hypothetical protein [Streptomyces canus]